MEMNSATTTNTNWLRHMKVGRSYVRYYDNHKLLHSAQTSIYKFNKGLGDGSKVFLRTRTRVIKKAEIGKVFKLSVTCMSNKKTVPTMTENVNGNPNNEQNKSSKFNSEDEVKLSEEIKDLLKALGIGYDDAAVRERINDQKQLMAILTARVKKQKEAKKRLAKPKAKRKSASYRHLSMLDVVISSQDPHKLYNPHEAAEFLGLTVWAVRKRIQRGTIYAELVDNAYVTPHAELVRKIRQAFHFKKR